MLRSRNRIDQKLLNYFRLKKNLVQDEIFKKVESDEELLPDQDELPSLVNHSSTIAPLANDIVSIDDLD